VDRGRKVAKAATASSSRAPRRAPRVCLVRLRRTSASAGASTRGWRHL